MKESDGNRAGLGRISDVSQIMELSEGEKTKPQDVERRKSVQRIHTAEPAINLWWMGPSSLGNFPSICKARNLSACFSTEVQ